MAKPSINDSRESIRWYTRILKNLNTREIRKEGLGEYVSFPQLGKLCCYWYDPKTKETLPYYDRFPLVMPLDYQDNGYVLGLNLHYLPPVARKVLFDQLFDVRARKDLTRENQIMMSYMVLKRTSQFPGWRDCIKRYIPSHFQSRILEIDPLSWKLAVALPTQQFVKGKPW
jgi:hypothetical protein